jgi:hypothetical protein
VKAIGKKSKTVFFFPKLSLSLTSFNPSAVFVLSEKSGAFVPIERAISLSCQISAAVPYRRNIDYRNTGNPGQWG